MSVVMTAATWAGFPDVQRRSGMARATTSASKPMPAIVAKYRSFTLPTSMRRRTPLCSTRPTPVALVGRPKERARMFAVPPGTKAKAGRCASATIIRPLRASFSVPSPPIATTTSAPVRAAASAASRAWPGSLAIVSRNSAPVGGSIARMVDHMRWPRPPPAVGLMMTRMVPERGLRATSHEPAVLSPPRWVVAPTAGFEPYEFNGADLHPLRPAPLLGHPSPRDFDEFTYDFFRRAPPHDQPVIGPFELMEGGGG